jgi:tetratricopeptide (TPR) repeat protein
MINRLLVITAILFLHITSFASPYSKWWDDGNRFYKQKQYDSAAFYFEKIAAMKPADATVYYNLGNTYYRLNEIGNAVLNYERALKFNPSLKEAKDNLSLTQNRIPNRIAETEDIFFMRWWKAMASPAMTTVWSILSLTFFIAVIAISILKVLGAINFTTRKLQTILLSLWALTLILAYSSTRQKLEEKAVIMQDNTPLMNGSKQGKSIGNIPEGTTVEINSETGVQTEITLPDGRSGWVDKSSLIKI